jgi:hypothetical protein
MKAPHNWFDHTINRSAMMKQKCQKWPPKQNTYESDQASKTKPLPKGEKRRPQQYYGWNSKKRSETPMHWLCRIHCNATNTCSNDARHSWMMSCYRFHHSSNLGCRENVTESPNRARWRNTPCATREALSLHGDWWTERLHIRRMCSHPKLARLVWQVRPVGPTGQTGVVKDHEIQFGLHHWIGLVE